MSDPFRSGSQSDIFLCAVLCCRIVYLTMRTYLVGLVSMLLVAAASCAFVIPDLRHPEMRRDPSWELVRSVSSSRVTHAIDNDDVRLFCTSSHIDVAYASCANGSVHLVVYTGQLHFIVRLVAIVTTSVCVCVCVCVLEQTTWNTTTTCCPSLLCLTW